MDCRISHSEAPIQGSLLPPGDLEDSCVMQITQALGLSSEIKDKQRNVYTDGK